jgi:hypothetical protein
MATTATIDRGLPSHAALLLHDLALALHATPPAHVAVGLGDTDPLRLDLPALPGLRAAPEALQALGALYLAARLEEMGVLRAAEWLVAERAVLRVPVTTAAKLEDAARRRTESIAREQRALLFARLFGLGSGVGVDQAGANTRFEPLLAALCSALVTCGQRPAGPTDGPHAAVVQAGLQLAGTAGQAYAGGVALAVPRLGDQLRRAIDLISDSGVGALVGARGFWPTLRALLGPSAPDLRRLLDCGRHGQHVLRWLAGAVRVMETPPAGPEITPDAVTSAGAWLGACGLPLPARDPQARARGASIPWYGEG